MNRAELHQRANDWVAGAETLLAAGQWSLAYYLAGYAVEFALKACVLSRMIETGVVFREQVVIGGKARKWEAKDFRTHNFAELIDLAGLRAELDANRQADTTFAGHWSTVSKWTSEARYEAKLEADARELVSAVADPQHGVLAWLRTF